MVVLKKENLNPFLLFPMQFIFTCENLLVLLMWFFLVAFIFLIFYTLAKYIVGALSILSGEGTGEQKVEEMYLWPFLH